jgi:hypothetical protein
MTLDHIFDEIPKPLRRQLAGRRFDLFAGVDAGGIEAA